MGTLLNSKHLSPYLSGTQYNCSVTDLQPPARFLLLALNHFKSAITASYQTQTYSYLHLLDGLSHWTVWKNSSYLTQTVQFFAAYQGINTFKICK